MRWSTHAGGMEGRVWLEEGLSVCERLLIAMQEVGCVIVMGVWWNVIDVIVCLLVLSWLCCTSGIVCELAFGGRSKFLGEWASLRKRMVLFWVCPGLSLLVH